MSALPDLTHLMERARQREAFVDFWRAQARHRPIEDLPASPFHQRLVKAALSGDAAAFRNAASAFLDSAQTPTVLSRLTTWTMPATVGAPIIAIADGPIGDFLPEGAPAPNVVLAATAVTAETASIRFLITVDERTFQDSARGKAAMARAVTTAVGRAEDAKVLDDVAAVPHIRPAGLRFGAPVFSAVDTTPAAIAAALAAALGAVKAGAASTLVAITNPQTLGWLSATGAAEATAETLSGLPVIVSPSAPPSLVVFLDPTALAVADDGLTIDTARSASVDLAAVPAAQPTALTSLFQTNALSLRVARFIWWYATPGSVAVADLGLS